MVKPDEAEYVPQSTLTGDNSPKIEQRDNPITALLIVGTIYLLLEQFASVVLEKLSLFPYIGIRGTVQALLLLFAAALLNSQYPLVMRQYNKRLVLQFSLIGMILCFIRYIPFFMSVTANPHITTDYSTYLHLSGIHFVWSLILLVIIGPLTEELVFRGFIFRLILQKTNITIAAVISSLFFAATHGLQAGWLNHFLLGIFCCYVYSKSNSVWSSVLTHIGNNAIWFFCTGYLVNRF